MSGKVLPERIKRRIMSVKSQVSVHVHPCMKSQAREEARSPGWTGRHVSPENRFDDVGVAPPLCLRWNVTIDRSSCRTQQDVARDALRAAALEEEPGLPAK